MSAAVSSGGGNERTAQRQASGGGVVGRIGAGGQMREAASEGGDGGLDADGEAGTVRCSRQRSCLAIKIAVEKFAARAADRATRFEGRQCRNTMPMCDSTGVWIGR